MDIQTFITDTFLVYLADWKPWVLVAVAIMLNFWVLDLVNPKTAAGRRWTIRISSIIICVAVGIILFEQSKYVLISEVLIGVATPFLYRIGHGFLKWAKPGLAQSIEDAKIKDDEGSEK